MVSSETSAGRQEEEKKKRERAVKQNDEQCDEEIRKTRMIRCAHYAMHASMGRQKDAAGSSGRSGTEIDGVEGRKI